MRDVLDAILYIASAGCAWRMLPNDFPSVSTVRYYFYGWRNDGIFEVIPTASISDSVGIPKSVLI